MTPAHRIEVVLAEDGKLSLDQLPFRAGQVVEVIVLPVPSPSPGPIAHPLRGAVVRYDRPTDPVAEADWHVRPFQGAAWYPGEPPRGTRP